MVCNNFVVVDLFCGLFSCFLLSCLNDFSKFIEQNVVVIYIIIASSDEIFLF